MNIGEEAAAQSEKKRGLMGWCKKMGFGCVVHYLHQGAICQSLANVNGSKPRGVGKERLGKVML